MADKHDCDVEYDLEEEFEDSEEFEDLPSETMSLTTKDWTTMDITLTTSRSRKSPYMQEHLGMFKVEVQTHRQGPPQTHSQGPLLLTNQLMINIILPILVRSCSLRMPHLPKSRILLLDFPSGP